MQKKDIEEILKWLELCPDILSDEEWKRLDEKVKEAQTPPPGGDGFRLSEEDDTDAR